MNNSEKMIDLNISLKDSINLLELFNSIESQLDEVYMRSTIQRLKDEINRHIIIIPIVNEENIEKGFFYATKTGIENIDELINAKAYKLRS